MKQHVQVVLRMFDPHSTQAMTMLVTGITQVDPIYSYNLQKENPSRGR